MNIKDEFVSYEIAKELKDLGFDEPTPHCYVHEIGEKYELNLFYYLLGGDGELYNVFENEKKIKLFSLDDIQNESDVYFNYNQDIRKLLVKVYNGEEFVEDEKSYNMNIDSYTYQKWTPEEEKENKLKLPNYNNGDFDFTVYSDIISAPLYTQAFKWFRDKHDLDGYTHSFKKEYHFTIIDRKNFINLTINDVTLYGGIAQGEGIIFDTHEKAQEACLLKLIEIVKK
jgi:hypothetical protein